MVDAALLPKLQNLMSQMIHLKKIIYFGTAKKSLINEFPEHVEVYSLQQIKDIGSKLKHCRFIRFIYNTETASTKI